MARRSERPAKAPRRETLPRHRLPEPFAQLFKLGEESDEAAYINLATELDRGDREAAAATLVAIATDLEIDRYADDSLLSNQDPRSYARMHALYTLSCMGPISLPYIAELVRLLEDDNTDVVDAAITACGEIGKPALKPLLAVVNDRSKSTGARSAAVDALSDAAETEPGIRDEVVSELEAALNREDDCPELAGVIVIGLMDLNSRESMPMIQQAYAEERVDEVLVELYDVEEHFGIEHSAPRKNVFEEFMDIDVHDRKAAIEEDELIDEEEPEVQAPYVADVKAGRNDPCPCGSGKKFKKCCGA